MALNEKSFFFVIAKKCHNLFEIYGAIHAYGHCWASTAPHSFLLSNLRHLRALQKHWLIAFVLFRNGSELRKIIATNVQIQFFSPPKASFFTLNIYMHTCTLCNSNKTAFVFATCNIQAVYSASLNWIAIPAIYVRVLQCNNIFYRVFCYFGRELEKLHWIPTNELHFIHLFWRFMLMANKQISTLKTYNETHAKLM